MKVSRRIKEIFERIREFMERFYHRKEDVYIRECKTETLSREQLMSISVEGAIDVLKENFQELIKLMKVLKIRGVEAFPFFLEENAVGGSQYSSGVTIEDCLNRTKKNMEEVDFLIEEAEITKEEERDIRMYAFDIVEDLLEREERKERYSIVFFKHLILAIKENLDVNKMGKLIRLELNKEYRTDKRAKKRYIEEFESIKHSKEYDGFYRRIQSGETARYRLSGSWDTFFSWDFQTLQEIKLYQELIAEQEAEQPNNPPTPPTNILEWHGDKIEFNTLQEIKLYQELIAEQEAEQPTNPPQPQNILEWKGSKIEFLQLCKALSLSGKIEKDNKKVAFEALVNDLGFMFNVDEKNPQQAINTWKTNKKTTLENGRTLKSELFTTSLNKLMEDYVKGKPQQTIND